MSVRSDVGVCLSCGLVELAAKMVRVDDGEYAYYCGRCAVTAGAKLVGVRRAGP